MTKYRIIESHKPGFYLVQKQVQFWFSGKLTWKTLLPDPFILNPFPCGLREANEFLDNLIAKEKYQKKAPAVIREVEIDDQIQNY